MATEVTSFTRVMEEAESKRRDLFTRDLLGGGGGGGGGGVAGEESAVDLDLQVPSGWERHLDLMSGKTYLHKVDSDRILHASHDLNLPPPPLPENSALLDLNLAGATTFTGHFQSHFQSVCTLEKVKSALDRAGRPEPTSSASGSPSSSSATSTPAKRRPVAEEDGGGADSAGGMRAAACPSCLLYVLVSKGNPRCPRCDSHVPLAFVPKKRKFDLNSCC